MSRNTVELLRPSKSFVGLKRVFVTLFVSLIYGYKPMVKSLENLSFEGRCKVYCVIPTYVFSYSSKDKRLYVNFDHRLKF